MSDLNTPDAVPDESYRFAGFWWRAAAILIDVAILTVADGIVSGMLGAVLPAFTWLLVVVINWTYFAQQEASPYRATVGKRVCGLIVVDLEGRQISFARATGRYFAKFLSGLLLNLGFVMAAFTERKQGLHDFMAGTLVLRKRPGPKGTDAI